MLEQAGPVGRETDFSGTRPKIIFFRFFVQSALVKLFPDHVTELLSVDEETLRRYQILFH